MAYTMNINFVIFIGFALIFQLIMGANDGGTLLGSIVSSNFIHPIFAVVILFIGMFLAPFIFGTAIVKTLGTKILPLEYMNMQLLYGTIISTIIWVIIAQKIKYPVSISYTFVGALIGGGIATKFANKINRPEVYKIFGALIISILISFAIGFLLIKLINLLLHKAAPRTSMYFKILQVFTSVLLVMGYGANDAEKTLSLIYMAAYVTHTNIAANAKDPWIILALAAIFIVGTLLFGENVATTAGFRIMRSKPKQTFFAQLITSVTVLSFARIGLPVSSTETLNMGLIGTGAGEKPYSVRWNVVKNLLFVWIITIPASILLSYVVTLILEKMF